MIRLSATKELKNYNIDVNGIITDQDGVIQKTYLMNGRPTFKQVPVHRILMYTFFGYKENYVIHHKDKNILNNKLENLVYLTRAEHARIHAQNRIWSEESRKKMSISAMGNKNALGKRYVYRNKK